MSSVATSFEVEVTYYHIPLRFAQLTSTQMDLWDSLYYLAELNHRQLNKSMEVIRNLSHPVKGREPQRRIYCPSLDL